jgi:xanthine dehydrogenase YagS FAD-binding subunit
LIDISRIPGLNLLEVNASGGQIGALTTIQQVSEDPDIRRAYPGLSIAAGALATPQIRNAATMGGSLLQRSRCWYYRHEDFSCYKKGGDTCPARNGNHEFGVCFDLGNCVFPHPSTLGLVLMAYDAEVAIHGKGRRMLATLFGQQDGSDHTLLPGEILTDILLPPALEGEKAAYFRSISRARAEWPQVEAIVRFRIVDGLVSDARVGLGGVANVPLLLPKVDAALNGNAPSEELFRKAAALATEGANPLQMTGYKVELIPGTLLETLQRAMQGKTSGEG